MITLVSVFVVVGLALGGAWWLKFWPFAQGPVTLAFNINIGGEFTDKSTPIVAHITGTNDKNEKMDSYQLMTARISGSKDAQYTAKLSREN